MNSKILGGALLIIGTSIGAGMLALPVSTAAGGFMHSLALFLFSWFATVLGAFFMLEVNLWLPEGSNLVSMAKATLGPIGQVITWFCYLLLLYSLLAAYTAGGSDLLGGIFQAAHLSIPNWLNAFVFVLLLGSIVYFGIYAVDIANRSFMSVKFFTYAFLIALIVPNIHLEKLATGQWRALASAVMVVITSFGYASIIPSLRAYLKGDVKALRITIALGSLASLFFYLLWDLAVQGTIDAAGPNGLIRMSTSGQAASQLTAALSLQLEKHVSDLAHVFTSICVTTSFLGVGLCLRDFMADGLHIIKKGVGKIEVALFTFIPPLAIVLFYPGAFIVGLRYAGIFCVILLLLLPALMAWSGRYVKNMAYGYRVFGGKWLLTIEIIIALCLLANGLIHVL